MSVGIFSEPTLFRRESSSRAALFGVWIVLTAAGSEICYEHFKRLLVKEEYRGIFLLCLTMLPMNWFI